MKKIKGGSLGDFKKFPEKKFEMRFLNSVTGPKNVKGGTLWDFLASIVLQNIETNEGKTVRWNPKNFKKKVAQCRKKSEWKTPRGSYVFEVLDVDVFVLDEFGVSSMFWMSVVQVDVIGKSGPIALNRRKKTSHCKSRAFSSETPTKIRTLLPVMCKIGSSTLVVL